MKVPYEWLREYCAPTIELPRLVERLTQTGTKVEAVHTEGELVIEFEITPNRPDCLGVYGIAREVHAVTGAPLGTAPWAEDPGTPGRVADLGVAVVAPELCPRFTARVFEGVQVGPSPTWLQARLIAAGERPINNVVDITNYVMLLTGQPMHAFDLERVAGGELTVRRASEREQVTTLDGKERTLDDEMLVIADTKGPTSIAGVMGGARSEVHDGTSRVVIEAASWDGPNILRTSNILGLRSGASARFEKGLSPEQAMEAQSVATRLMLELTGATVAAGTIDVGGDRTPPSATIRLRRARVRALLGQEIPLDRQRATLCALGFTVEPAHDGLAVTVPPARRNDVTREADVVEEVARFELDELPTTLPRHRPAANLTAAQRLRRRAIDALVGRGLHEIVGWSFTDPGVADRLRLPDDDPRRRFVVLENPMSAEHAVLRTTLLGSVLDAAHYNVSRGARDLRLFEAGTVYRDRGEGLPEEDRLLCVLTHGSVTPQSWRAAQVDADVFAVKGVLETVAQALRVDVRTRLADTPEPFLQPGRSGVVTVAGKEIGWVGELHPFVADAWGLGTTACFELHLDRLLDAADAPPKFNAFTAYPAVRQDLAILVPLETPAELVFDIVRRHSTRSTLVDVFTGDQVDAGKRSLTMRCEFSAADRTLGDRDVAQVRTRLAGDLAEIGGTFRV